MKIQILLDADAVARQAAAVIAAAARDDVAARGRFVLAMSGGRTPWKMLQGLADEDLPWDSIEIVQVDERVAPAGDPDRNLTHLLDSLQNHAPIRPPQIHAMPVETAELEDGVAEYAKVLRQLAATPPVIDLVHLGLGADGHTASLVPGDPVLEIMERDVATTGLYQGRRRMTLTFPIINRARRVLWLVTGADKALPLRQLRDRDPSIPAGRVEQANATVLADAAAAAKL